MGVESGRNYKLINAQGNSSLDLDTNSARKVQGWSWHGGNNQRWQLTRTSNGWNIKNLHTGRFLGIEGNNPQNGTQVVAVDSPFEWQIWEDERNKANHRLFVPNTHFNLDLDCGRQNDGTTVHLWTKTEGTNQTWRFEQV